MTPQVKRFSPSLNPGRVRMPCMDLNPSDGEYVLYSDYAALAAKKDCECGWKAAEQWEQEAKRLEAEAQKLREALQECVWLLKQYPSHDPNGQVWGDMVPEIARSALSGKDQAKV